MKITLVFISIIFVTICNGQSFIGKWRRIIPSKPNSISDTILLPGDLAIKIDSTFIMQGDTTNSNIPGWHNDTVIGTWANPSKKQLIFWCDPKNDMIRIYLTIVTITEKELILKLGRSRIKYLRL